MYGCRGKRSSLRDCFVNSKSEHKIAVQDTPAVLVWQCRVKREHLYWLPWKSYTRPKSTRAEVKVKLGTLGCVTCDLYSHLPKTSCLRVHLSGPMLRAGAQRAMSSTPKLSSAAAPRLALLSRHMASSANAPAAGSSSSSGPSTHTDEVSVTLYLFPSAVLIVSVIYRLPYYLSPLIRHELSSLIVQRLSTHWTEK